MMFLIQTPHPWRGIRQRPHHLAEQFAARGHFVRWVEPRYLRWLAGRSDEFFRARAERPRPGIDVRPVTLVNGERFPPIRAHNKYWLGRALRRRLPRGQVAPRVLWLYNPHESHLADRVPHDLLIYDIMDEYRGFPWSPPRIAEEEATLLARADWVFAGTRALYEAKRPLAEGKIECILSGVDTEHFRRPTPKDEGGPGTTRCTVPTEHVDLRQRYRRLAGFAGMIDLRVDVGLLLEAARRFPDWAFVLLGPIMIDASPLRACPNIRLLGQVNYENLPAYYQDWDAALLPFVENELTRHINPTKILEYAAVGVPIVARALPDVRECYAEGAWLYDTKEEFMANLEAIGKSEPDAFTARLEIARRWANERSWPALTEQMLARVEELYRARL